MSKLLPRAIPSSEGIPAKSLIKMLDELKEKKVDFHSIMIARHEKVIFECWQKPYAPTLPHMLFSLSNSFTSTAIGFAVSEGLLSVEDYLISFFPEKLPAKPCENMQKMKIEHLLTMSTGHSEEPDIFSDEGDNVKRFLWSYVDLEPGSHFVQNTPAAYMLSAVIHKLTGQNLVEYLTPRLFEPLNIKNVCWDSDNAGISMGGFGLSLKTEDIMKFGIMLLNNGIYNGRQIIGEDWIKNATSHMVDNYSELDWGADCGYQFRQCSYPNMFRADGTFGQLCCVMRNEGIVIVTTAGIHDIQQLLSIIRDNLISDLRSEPFKDHAADENRLEQAASELMMKTPDGAPQSDELKKYDGVCCALSSNLYHIEKITFFFNAVPSVKIEINGDSMVFPMGYKEFAEGGNSCKGSYPLQDISIAYAADKNVLKLELAFNTTPFIDRLEFTFDDKGLVGKRSRNIGFSEDKETFFGRYI